jgi:AcrR family transcriptional regulator
MGPKQPPEYAELQRKRILEAAWDLFAERGYHETTMREIAARLGMSTGVLYGHFAGKDDIIRALADRSRRSNAEMLETLSKERTTRRALEVLFDMLVTVWSADDQKRGAKGNISLLAEAVRREDMREQASELYGRTAELFTKLAEAGVRKGEFGHSVEPAGLGSLLAALFLGLQTERVLLGDTDAGEHLSAVRSVLLRNIWRDTDEEAGERRTGA